LKYRPRPPPKPFIGFYARFHGSFSLTREKRVKDNTLLNFDGAKSAIPDLLYFDPSQNPAMAKGSLWFYLSGFCLSGGERKQIPKR
jgi:hypothetical protein